MAYEAVLKMSDDRQVCKCDSEEEAWAGVSITETPLTRSEGMSQEGVDKGRAGLRGSSCRREHLFVKVVPKS